MDGLHDCRDKRAGRSTNPVVIENASCSQLGDCDHHLHASASRRPVSDPSTRTMYLVGLHEGLTGTDHFLHALNLTSRAERICGALEISRTAPGVGREQHERHGRVQSGEFRPESL